MKLFHRHQWQDLDREPSSVLTIGKWFEATFRGKLHQGCATCGEHRRINA